MAVLQRHLAHQSLLRQDLVYHGVSRRIAASLTVVHDMLTMTPKYREAFSFHENPADVLDCCQDRVV